MTDHDHYFTDSSGHMWVDITAVKDSVELIPIEDSDDVPSELSIGICDVLVNKEYPQLSLVLDKDGDRAVKEL